jgi:hypothetical protein
MFDSFLGGRLFMSLSFFFFKKKLSSSQCGSASICIYESFLACQD